MSETTRVHRTAPASRPPASDKPPASPPPWRQWLIPLGVLLTVWLLFGDVVANLSGGVEQLDYTTFVQRVDAGKVKTADISATGSIAGELKGGTPYETAIPTALDDQGLARRLERHAVAITAVPTSDVGGIIVSLAPLLVLVGLFWWVGRRTAGQLGGVLGGIGRSRAKVFDAQRPTTRFADVAGYAGVKQEIVEVVDFLKAPDRYRSAGATGPRGVLMVGPPARARRCWLVPWPVRPRCRSCR
jgi:cell division protease FtsH